MAQPNSENWNQELATLAAAYPGHPLLAELETMAERYSKLERRLGKVVSISDKLQRDMIQLNQTLEKMALTDSLTALLNRHGMNKCLQAEWNRMRREALPFGLLILDIDHFKRVNDTFGHAAGDRVLAEMARRLKDMTRNYDSCCRWGGEEFLVLLPDTGRKGVDTVCQKLREALLDHPIVEDGQPISITFSAGAHIATADETLDQCIKQADDALYRAKRKGRNCRVWSTSSGTKRKIEEQTVEPQRRKGAEEKQ